MFDKLTNLFSSGVEKVIDSVGNAIDKNVTNDEERQQLTNALIEIQETAKLEQEKLALNFEQEYTKRQALDMQSDDMLSKRIRPMTLIYLLIVVSVLALTDGNIKYDDYVYKINSEYVELFKSLLLMVFAFYFGSRGVEKVAKIWKG